LESSKLPITFVTYTRNGGKCAKIFYFILYFIIYSNFFNFQTMTLYVGNLSFSLTNDELEKIFSQYGTVTKVSIIIDRENGRSKGFGFVEFAEASHAKKAVEAMNGALVSGRNLKVNEAQPRQ
jgi:RNA recognition motif-containing protein